MADSSSEDRKLHARRRNKISQKTVPFSALFDNFRRLAGMIEAGCPILTSCLSTLEPALREAEGVGFHQRVKAVATNLAIHQNAFTEHGEPGTENRLRYTSSSCPWSPISMPSARESGRKWSATQLFFAWARTSASTAALSKSPTASSTASGLSA